MTEFAQWISQSYPSLFIQNHYSWAIPTIQSIHIVAIGIVLVSVFMVDLRILGWGGMDQTLMQTTNRFAPWLKGALGVLLVTGVLMVIGEPVRELVTVSFWLKMFLVVVGTSVAAVFLRTLRKNGQQWEESLARRRGVKVLSILTFLIWIAIIVLGRLIAYDHIWGAWSPAARV
jgi:hypothetical protein